MKINTYAVNCNDAWLNTEGDDISGSYVKYKDHHAVVAALEAKCAALAAENAGLKNFISEECLVRNPLSRNQLCAEDVSDALAPETPATDEFLAEVRAQGVELFAREMHADISEADAIEFAAKLRQDANTAELVAAGIITRIED